MRAAQRIIAAGVLAGSAVLWTTVVAAGDAKRGQILFERQCAVCHSTLPEYHREGPSLHGIYGQRAGQVPFFGRYKGLRGKAVVWDSATLDAYLADPRAFVGGRDPGMTFQNTNPQERADIIAYLKTLR